MLQELLTAEPDLARRFRLPSVASAKEGLPLAGTVVPFVGGMPCSTDVIPKLTGSGCGLTDSVIAQSGGNIGIGTPSPQAKLHLSDAAEDVELLRLGSTSSTWGSTENTARMMWLGAGQAHGVVSYRPFDRDFYFTGFANGYDDTPANLRAKGILKIDGTGNSYFLGNVGIGTTTPGALLHVSGGGVGLGTSGIDLTNTASGGRTYKLSAGVKGVTEGGFSIMDRTAGDVHRLMIDNAGNVGIGTTSPDSKLDVRGSVNKIFFLRQGTGTDPTDDGKLINDTIDALPNDGGIIYLLPGTYNIKTTVRNGSKKAVKIRGFGGAAIDNHVGLTSLKWDTSVTGNGLRVVSFESPSATLFSQDFEISDLTIDGSGVAEVGLFINRISTSKFISVQIKNLKRTTAAQSPSVGIYLIAFGGTQGVNWNTFINCSVDGAARGLYLAVGGGSTGNPSHNSFLGLSIAYYQEFAQNAGIWLDDCDNNLFERVWIFAVPESGPPFPDPTGYGVVINNPIARANYFYHLQACAIARPGAKSLKVINAGTPAARNLIFGYDLENAEIQPVTDTGASPADYLYWVDSRGVTHLGKNTGFSSPTLDGTLENVGASLHITLGGSRRQILTT